MSEFFADGYLRYQEGAWRDDNGDAVEIQPVRHGRWEWITEDIYRCTNCGTTNHVKEVMCKPDFNYCPECSADMRGRNKDGICEKS